MSDTLTLRAENAVKKAEEALEKAKKDLATLAQIPAVDNYPIGTFIIWQKETDRHPRVSIKRQRHEVVTPWWSTTSVAAGTRATWDYMRQTHWSVETIVRWEVHHVDRLDRDLTFTTEPEHWKQWLHELRTTDAGQAHGHMSRITLAEGDTHGKINNCCLAVGTRLVPDIKITQGTGFTRSQFKFGEHQHYRTAPIEFIRWVGLGHMVGDVNETASFDVVLDYTHPGATQDGALLNPDDVTGAWMNDTVRLTFPQIADMLDYFGVKALV